MNDLEIYELFKECSNSYEEQTIYEDPMIFFGIDYVKESNEILMEAKSATSKNIFQKIWKIIVKAFGSIGNMFSKLIKWIKGIFFRKNNAKTADQIAIDSGLSYDNSISTISADNTKSVIEIPSDEKSELELPPIEIVIKDLLVKYDKEKKSIIFNLKEIRKRSYQSYSAVKPDDKHGKIGGQASIGFNYLYAFRMILHHDIMDSFVSIVTKLCEYSVDSTKEINIPTLLSDYNKIKSVAYTKSENEDVEISFEDFEKFSLKIMEINKKLADVNLTTNGADETKEHVYGSIIGRTYDTKLIELINDIAGFSFEMQMGINAITATIQQSFIVDKRFSETCKTLENLDKFVSECIYAGLPPKYIAYNAWIIMSKSLKGSNSDKNKPIWGQSRAVYYPDVDPKSVYKLALSSNGIFANKTERDITVKAENSTNNMTSRARELFDYIAKTTAITPNGTVSTMERASSNEKPDDKIIIELANKVQGPKGILKDANFTIQDLHMGNARKMPDGKWKFIDYGLAYSSKLNKR